MHKTVLVTLADSKCTEGQKKISESAQTNGEINSVINWQWSQFKETMWFHNHKIFAEKRGLGYWAWKPFIILSAMKDIKDGDVVVYHDSGRDCYGWQFAKSINGFVDKVVKKHKGLGLVFGPWNHGKMTKKDCFINMGCNSSQYHKHRQVSATWSVWQKNEFCVSILKEWCNWVTHETRIISDDKSVLDTELDEYSTHRHDQSILTNILLRYIFTNQYNPIFSNGKYEKNINNFL
jgi:hypothetical protein